MANKPSFKKQEENRGGQLSDYWPLFSLIMIAALAAVALVWHNNGGLVGWMHYFMGVFLCSFAMLKIFTPAAFVDGFHMYDLITRQWRGYGYIYPYIELGLGLSYLAFLAPQTTYIVTIVVMTIGALGVARALAKGLDVNCPCMGSVLSVPLSTVTLTEDVGMALMAALMLAMHMQ